MRIPLILALVGFLSSEAYAQQAVEEAKELFANLPKWTEESDAGRDAINRGDYEAGLKIWRDTAESGNQFTQLDLCLFHFFAVEGKPDRDRYRSDQEALKYCGDLAIKGLPQPQYAMGMMNFHGRGVEKNEHKGAFWFKEAAEGDQGDAQFVLGVFYMLGRGVPQDLVLAHHWLNLAAGKGDEDAIKARNDIQQMLSQQQLEEANRITREWKPRQIIYTP